MEALTVHDRKVARDFVTADLRESTEGLAVRLSRSGHYAALLLSPDAAEELGIWLIRAAAVVRASGDAT